MLDIGGVDETDEGIFAEIISGSWGVDVVRVGGVAKLLFNFCGWVSGSGMDDVDDADGVDALDGVDGLR